LLFFTLFDKIIRDYYLISLAIVKLKGEYSNQIQVIALKQGELEGFGTKGINILGLY